MRGGARLRFSAGRSGFTLVELLVVISIVGILVGLTAVGVSKAIAAGEKAKAKSDLSALVSAVKAYQREYSRFPCTAGPTDDEHLYASYATGQPKFSTQPFGTSADLVAILCGEDRKGLNPKRIRFLEPGKLEANGGEKFIWRDPWKQEYCVMFDSNEDGGVEYWGDGNWEHPNLRVSVIAISAGPNQQVDGSTVNSSKCDDIFSWQ